MATQNISKAIKDLRDTIVGKVPLPNDQVDQITLALLYKFMDDMDQVGIAMGGVATFFSGEYEKYSWKKIMSSSKGAQERYNLYAEGLEKFYSNSALPDTFRSIFKNATIKNIDIVLESRIDIHLFEITFCDDMQHNRVQLHQKSLHMCLVLECMYKHLCKFLFVLKQQLFHQQSNLTNIHH